MYENNDLKQKRQKCPLSSVKHRFSNGSPDIPGNFPFPNDS